METFVYKERTPLNPIAFFLSILILFGIFWLYLNLRPVLADPESYVFLANLRAITEEGAFFSWEEPLPVLLVFFWKTIFGMNYLTSFQSIAALLFSLNLHLILLLFRKGEWKFNHHFLVYISAFLPYSHEFPILFFHELVGLTFILLIFHTFRMETILDLFLFPALLLVAFFTDLRMFLFGFTVFTLWSCLRSMSSNKARTTVFYKRKNIPFIILVTYLMSLFTLLVVFSILDFFGTSSFLELVYHSASTTLYISPAFLTLFVGNILLGTEKELNTRTFTGILVAGILVAVYFNYSKYDETIDDLLESKKENFIRSQSLIAGTNSIYSDPITAHYIYFATKLKHKFYEVLTREGNSYLYLDDIWQADIVDIIRRFPARKKDRRSELMQLGDRSILLSKSLQDKIVSDKTSTSYKTKLEENLGKFSKLYLYQDYIIWQQSILGYSNLQK